MSCTNMEELCLNIQSALGIAPINSSGMADTSHGIFVDVNETLIQSFQNDSMAVIADNLSSDASQTLTDIQVSELLVKWTMPLICIFGAIGNMLNLIVLTLRMKEGTELMEKGVLYGLICLALSDFLFCIVTLPWSFIDNHGIIYLDRGFQYYYAIASEPIQVSFIICVA